MLTLFIYIYYRRLGLSVALSYRPERPSTCIYICVYMRVCVFLSVCI